MQYVRSLNIEDYKSCVKERVNPPMELHGVLVCGCGS